MHAQPNSIYVRSCIVLLDSYILYTSHKFTISEGTEVTCWIFDTAVASYFVDFNAKQ